MNFRYLIDKIEAAPFSNEPFLHVYIEDFFSADHFEEVISSPQVRLGPIDSDEDLVQDLHELGFREIMFPGTAPSVKEYFSWRRKRGPREHTNIETCEGYGVAMRLKMEQAKTLAQELNQFFNSTEFLSTLAQKFGICLEDTYADNGLQKYLDGYEISPHPDIRSKALTYMINVNPASNSEQIHFHTHYMKFVPSKAYVEHYWRGNPQHDRCWVPWDWCETVKVQSENNSIVIFSPDNNTIHAVRADYDHLATQRTQFYGNLWYRQKQTLDKPNWRDYLVNATDERRARTTLKAKFISSIPFRKQLRQIKRRFF